MSLRSLTIKYDVLPRPKPQHHDLPRLIQTFTPFQTFSKKFPIKPFQIFKQPGHLVILHVPIPISPRNV
jgi:hypothetical protein